VVLRRLRPALVVVVLALGVFAGCGDETPDNNAAASTTTGAAATMNFYGIVTDEAGAPVEHAALEIISQDGYAVPELAVVTNAEGAYDGPPLRVGRYTVNVTADGFAKATKDAAIEEGKATELDFQLSR
jgi:Carboxypeptidase regulatory-like domain